jgi:hypothetical protein
MMLSICDIDGGTTSASPHLSSNNCDPNKSSTWAICTGEGSRLSQKQVQLHKPARLHKPAGL